MYWLGHSENYFFVMSKQVLIGSKFSKNIVFSFENITHALACVTFVRDACSRYCKLLILQLSILFSPMWFD